MEEQKQQQTSTENNSVKQDPNNLDQDPVVFPEIKSPPAAQKPVPPQEKASTKDTTSSVVKRRTQCKIVQDTNDSFFSPPENASTLRKALNEKTLIIESHRNLVKQLYSHVDNLEQTVQLMKQVVKILKRTLIENKIPLPDLPGNPTNERGGGVTYYRDLYS
jgi:hypothetical protein